MLKLSVGPCFLAALLLATVGLRADDWTTLGADAQRSSWVRADAKTTPETVAGPDYGLLWRMQLPNEARSGSALTSPALLDFLISHRGFRSLAFVGGSSGGVFAMDTDLERMEWQRHFLPGSSETSAECPGGMTTSVTRPTAAPMPSILGFPARGRREPAYSGVGKPGEGAVTLAAASAPVRPAPSASLDSSRTRPPARPSLRGVTLVYALSADGFLHSLYASNGRDHVAPQRFLGPDAHARGLIVVDGVAYVATLNGCGGAADGVWALDLESGSVSSWASDGGPVAGLGGLAMGPDGTVYATTRNGALVALEPGTLNLRQASSPLGFGSSPVVVDLNGSDHVAALARDGSLHVFESDRLEAEVAATPAQEGASGADTALAAWKDGGGTQWILVPSGQAAVAWKLVADDSGISLVRGWQSPELQTPLPPIVVGSVVFVLDGGNATQGARLYALKAADGGRIWDSGDAIKVPARGHTLAAGPGHVFLTASDSAVYAFGFPMEH